MCIRREDVTKLGDDAWRRYSSSKKYCTYYQLAQCPLFVSALMWDCEELWSWACVCGYTTESAGPKLNGLSGSAANRKNAKVRNIRIPVSGRVLFSPPFLQCSRPWPKIYSENMIRACKIIYILKSILLSRVFFSLKEVPFIS